MTVLITGGLGYIGRQLALSMKENCLIVDNRSDPFVLEDRKMLTKAGHSILNKEMISVLDPELFRFYDITKVVHLAAKISVPEGEANPGLYYSENVNKTAMLFAASVLAGVKNFVFASSAAVYPEGAIDRLCWPDPANWYGRTKWAAEGILEGGHIDGMSPTTTILRFFNIVGADPALRTGKRNGGDILSVLLDKAFTGQPFTLYGDDWNTEDGTAVRDFVSVQDVVLQIREALERDDSKLRVQNTASFRHTSMRKLIAMATDISGYPIKVEVQPRRAGDIGLSTCTPLAGDLLPTVDLMTDIQTAWDWRVKQG